MMSGAKNFLFEIPPNQDNTIEKHRHITWQFNFTQPEQCFVKYLRYEGSCNKILGSIDALLMLYFLLKF